MPNWNIFRVLGDLSHASAKAILIVTIHWNRSAEGVSLITQALYALVFCTRYIDLFRTHILWNYVLKIIYISSSFYTLGIMQWLFPRTRERELSWKLGAGVLGVALLVSPFAMLIFEAKNDWSFSQWLRVFSEVLEAGCVLPQLLLLRQTTVPTVINSFYLLALASYRGLYVLNWLVRAIDKSDKGPDAWDVICGVVQTALYIDFFWVYYTRQRVKLRGGGVVDADDIRRGWLLGRIFGKVTDGNDEESAPALGGRRTSRPNWGARGISVSADEDVFDGRHHDEEEGLDPDAKMQDPDELAKAMDDDDDEGAPPAAGSSRGASDVPNGMRSGDEWDD